MVLTYKSLPEFRNTSPETRDVVWARCLKRAPQRHRDVFIFWACVAILAICFNLLLLGWLLEIQRGLLPAFSYPIAFFSAEGFWRLVLLHRARRFIAAEMPDHCPACGYDCSGIGADRCPECGVAVHPAATARGSVEHLTPLPEIS